MDKTNKSTKMKMFNPIKINQGFHQVDYFCRESFHPKLMFLSIFRVGLTSRVNMQLPFFSLGCENKPRSGYLLATVASRFRVGILLQGKYRIANRFAPCTCWGWKKNMFFFDQTILPTHPGKLIFWTQNWGLENDVPISSGWFLRWTSRQFIPGCRWKKIGRLFLTFCWFSS